MKLFFTLVFSLLGNGLVFSQTFNVSGTVSDFHNKSVLPHAKVKLGSKSAESDNQGRFEIKNVAAGTYQLTARHPECDDFSESVTVQNHLHLTISLEHHPHDIETVTLHGTHAKSGSVVIKTINKEEIARNSTANLGNLISSISGVGTLKTGNNIAKPIIHGLYGSRISILNNGVRLAEQEWGVEHAPNVDVNNFEHIDVIKGASALKYGSDAVGGVILLEPEIFPKKDTVKGSLNLFGFTNGRGFGTDVNVTKAWKNGWGIKNGGTFRQAGDLSAPDYNLKNTGQNFNSFNFSLQNNSFKKGIALDYNLTQQTIGILRDSHVSAPSDYARAMSVLVPVYSGDFSYDLDNPKQEIDHHLVKLSGYNRFKNIGKISANYSFQYNHRKEYDIRRGDLNTIPSLDLVLMTHQANVNDLLERENWSLETGIDGMYQNNYSDPATEARRLIPNYDKWYAGVYSVFKYKLSPSLNLESALRYDYTQYEVTKWFDKSDWESYYAAQYPQFYVRTNQNRVLTKPSLNYQNVSFNAGLEYHPSGNFNLKFNYAKVGRAPNIAELFADGLHHSAAIIERGNMSIKNENGHQFNLIADVKVPVLQGLEISANPYFFMTKNFINQVPNGVLQPTQYGTFPVWSYQQIDARMWGADLDINWKLTTNLIYKGRASYVYGQDMTNNEPLILMLPPNFSNGLTFNQEKWKNFYITVENRVFLQQNRFPVHDISYTDYEEGNQITKVLDISTPPPAYALWNVSAGVNLYKNLSVGLVANNILNVSYRDYLNRLRLFADEAGRNIIFNVRYNF